MVMCVAGPVLPALTAILSSPARMYDCVIVTLVEDDGSMPSVLRAVAGESIFTPHAMKPSVLLTITWKFGELRNVIPYTVKSLEESTTSSRKQFCLALLTLASWARSHHVMF